MIRLQALICGKWAPEVCRATQVYDFFKFIPGADSNLDALYIHVLHSQAMPYKMVLQACGGYLSEARCFALRKGGSER